MPTLVRLPLLSLLVAAWLFRPATAKPPVDLPDLAEQSPFELAVHPQNPLRPGPAAAGDEMVQIEPGSSLPLLFELTYTGTQPVTIYWGRQAYNNWVRLTIDTPRGRKLVTSYNDAELRPEAAGEKQIVTLQKGDTVRGRFFVGSGSSRVQEFQFREPGVHKLTASVGLFEVKGDPQQAESWHSRGRITARPVSFAVKPGNAANVKFRRVHGRVIDAKGAGVPLADVYVQVERTAMQSPLMEKQFSPYDRTVSDAKGRFEFPSFPANEPRLMLGVIHRSLPPTHKVVTVDAASEDLEVDIPMSPGRTVSGTVVDLQGRPLSGVGVGRPRVPWKYLPGTIVTGADGRFTLEGIPEKATYLQAHQRDLEVVDKSNTVAAGTEPVSMTIVMQPRQRDARELTGIARFGNGQPAGDLELSMWFDSPDRKSPFARRCVTAGDGRFKIELPADVASAETSLAGLVEVARPPEEWNPRTEQLEQAKPGENFFHDQVARSRWMTRFELAPGQREIELEFRRDHTIRLQLTSAIPLPEALDVEVTLSTKPRQQYKSRWIANETLAGDQLIDLIYRDLTPGDYEISVRLDQDRRYHFDAHWEKELNIPFDAEPSQQEVAIQIPEVRFGSVSVNVRNADGSKPADRSTVWMNAHKAHGWQPIIDGVATFPVVPVGPFTIRYNEQNGITAVPIRSQIEAGEETTLGPLVLRSTEEVYGYVSGRVLLADGTPALGTNVGLQNYLPSSSFRSLDGRNIDGNGGFRVSAPPQNDLLVINLSACDLWPPGSATDKAAAPAFGSALGGIGSPPSGTLQPNRDVVRPVRLIAGQEQAMDIILPDVEFRDVTIEFPLADNQRAYLQLWTDLGNSYFHVDASVGREGRARLRHIPDLPTRAILSVTEKSANGKSERRFAGVVPVPDGAAPVVRCDLTQAGQLDLRTIIGEDAGQAWYQVRIDDEKLPGKIGTLVGGSILNQISSGGETTTFRLAPARYTVIARYGKEQREQTVEIKRDGKHQLQFDFTAKER